MASVSRTVSDYMSMSAVRAAYTSPSDLPSYRINSERMKEQRATVAAQIRARKLARRRIWEDLGDQYLAVHHKVISLSVCLFIYI